MAVDCLVRHELGDVLLTLILLVGIVISYLPQHVKILRLNSSAGISPWYLLLGGLASFSSLCNISLLQWPYVACCPHVDSLQCMANLLGLLQIALQWAMFLFIFVLYFAKFPPALKYKASDAQHSDLWRFSLAVRRIVCYYAGALLALFVLVSAAWGLPSRASVWLAGLLGIFALALNCFQFLPQIHATYRSGRVGALSTSAMSMQAPGSLLFSYTLARSPGTNATTWLAFAVGGCLQMLLLALCLHLKRKQQGEYLVLPNAADADDIVLEPHGQ